MLRRFPASAMLAACLNVMMSPVFAADNASIGVPAARVYVADFDLDAATLTPDSGPGQRVRRLRGLLPDGPGPIGRDADPQQHAQHIVKRMADAITQDLKNAGVDARRLARGDAVPTDGWQVRGVFISVDDGNRLRRAMVGLGAGRNDVQVAVSCDRSSADASAALPPLYETVEETGGASLPGAAIRLNPYVIAAKFVMARGDESKTIDRTAQDITDAVLAKLHAAAQ